MKKESNTEFCFSNLGSYGMLDDLRKILLKSPNNKASKYGLAIVNVIDEDLEGAIQTLNSIIEEYPKSALMHRRIAEIFIYQSQHEKALKHLEKAVELDESDLTSLTWLSLIYHQLGKTEKALLKQKTLENFVFLMHVSRF